MRRFSKTCFTLLFLLTFTLFVFACGSSGSSTGDSDNNDEQAADEGSSDLTDAQEANATSFMQTIFSSLGLAVSASSNVQNSLLPKSFMKSQEFDCDSGSMVTGDGGNTLTFSECALNIGEFSIIFDGSFALTVDGSTTTVTYDLSVTFTDASSTEIFTMDGFIAETDSTTTFDLDALFDGESMSMTGELTDAGGGVYTGEITFTVDGETATCVFTDFNPDTANESDYAYACGF